MSLAFPPLYTRRVSFNNLLTEETGEPAHSPFLSVPLPPPDATDFLKVFGNYTFARKRVRLPDPPARLILRNRLLPAQLSSNVQHAIAAGAALDIDVNDLVAHPKHVPRLEWARIVRADGLDALQNGDLQNGDLQNGDALEDKNEDPLVPRAHAPTAPDPGARGAAPAAEPGARRKLYAGMSDEELMALDPQFAPRADVERFKFDVHAAPAPARRASMPQLTPRPAKHIIYPLLNENNYRAVLVTAKHAHYDRTREPRTLLTVLSGRRHTWNALDWLTAAADHVADAQLFLIHGDHLVVALLVPRAVQAGARRALVEGRRALAASHRVTDEALTVRAGRLLAYIVDRLPSELEVKVTVEFVMDDGQGPKHMLRHVFGQYQPTLVAVGSRSTSLNFRYRLRTARAPPAAREPDRYLCKLLSHLVRHSPVPVVIVGNRTAFHTAVAPAPPVQVTFTLAYQEPRARSIYNAPESAHDSATGSAHGSAHGSATGSAHDSAGARKNSAASDLLIESFCGGSSSELVASAPSLGAAVAALASLGAASRFHEMAAVVLALLVAELRQYLEAVRAHGADNLPRRVLLSKAHDAYVSGAPAGVSAAPVHKVKSLISYSEEDEKKNEVKLSRKKSAPPAPEKKKSLLQRMRLKK